MEDAVKYLRDSKVLSDIDYVFADFINDIAKRNGLPPSPLLEFSAMLLSYFCSGMKYSCLDLSELAGKSLEEILPELPRGSSCRAKLPALDDWLAELGRFPELIGKPGEFKPILIEYCSLLYLRRYHDYESRLAAGLMKRISVPRGEGVNYKLLQDGLKKYFSGNTNKPDWQKIAAFSAFYNNCSIISGGPGTGKTSTASAIIAMALEQAQGRSMNILLAAPTGKAALRLQTSLLRELDRFQKAGLTESCELPCEASTIHRLLGYIPDSPYFRFNHKNKLDADFLILDEASMVPLALMDKLFEALPDRCRVILLGDKDQLASVEAGSVLSDISEAAAVNDFSPAFKEKYKELTSEDIPSAGNAGGSIKDLLTVLQHSYRFSSEKGIGSLCRAVNEGDSVSAIALLENDLSGEIKSDRLPSPVLLGRRLAEGVIEYFSKIKDCDNVESALEALNEFKILAAEREGSMGVKAINSLCEKLLREKGLVKTESPFYHARPLLINKNDYVLGLFNGDMGLFWDDGDGNGNSAVRAVFRAADGKIKKYSPYMLPEYETAFAMTIHKTQGSEFERVLIILPEYESPVLNRELLYTGISRARKNIELWFEPDILKKAIASHGGRCSGLKQRLC